jgi:hypothetical protein
VVLTLRHTNYQPLDLDVRAGGLHFRNEITVAKMVPLASEAVAKSSHPPSVVSNTRVRYSINTGAQTNIGSAVKTFQVVNKGNVPCDGQSPCSPDGKWKAASGSASLYAGEDNVFNNVRASPGLARLHASRQVKICKVSATSRLRRWIGRIQLLSSWKRRSFMRRYVLTSENSIPSYLAADSTLRFLQRRRASRSRPRLMALQWSFPWARAST